MEGKKLKELQKKVETLAQSYGLVNCGFFGSIEIKKDREKTECDFVGFQVETTDAINAGFNTARFYQFVRERLAQHLRDIENHAQWKEVKDGTE